MPISLNFSINKGNFQFILRKGLHLSNSSITIEKAKRLYTTKGELLCGEIKIENY